MIDTITSASAVMMVSMDVWTYGRRIKGVEAVMSMKCMHGYYTLHITDGMSNNTHDNTTLARRPWGDDSSFLSNAAQRNEAVVVIIMACNFNYRTYL